MGLTGENAAEMATNKKEGLEFIKSLFLSEIQRARGIKYPLPPK
jgi:hypothetical protein